jgi:fatty acid desaturase
MLDIPNVDPIAETKPAERFPRRQAKEIIQDLFVPNPMIYWADFTFHVTLGWAAFVFALAAPTFSLWQAASYLIAALALYRSVIFIHELAHLKATTFPTFRIVWNLICGFPLMIPSFTYYTVHNDHHKTRLYGTVDDGEYLPLVAESPYKIILYLLLSFVLPIIFAVRFVLLTPLSFLHQGLRRVVWRHASSLAIDLRYCRPDPPAKYRRAWLVQEILTCCYGVGAIALVAMGILSYKALVLWYLIATLIFFLNSLRTLAAHAYRNSGNQVMNFEEQYLDSVNVPGSRFLTALWAPVGLRYHATHHLFAATPYHALREAHRRLAAELPDNSLYLEATRDSLWDALKRLWKEASLAESGTQEERAASWH